MLCRWTARRITLSAIQEGKAPEAMAEGAGNPLLVLCGNELISIRHKTISIVNTECRLNTRNKGETEGQKGRQIERDRPERLGKKQAVKQNHMHTNRLEEREIDREEE